MPSNNSKRRHRINRAIHLHYTTNMTNKEIADELDVTPQTVSKYLNEDMGEEVQEMLQQERQRVMKESLTILKQQLRDLHEQMEEVQVEKEEAETAVKVYTDDNGDLVYDTVTDDNGVERMFKVPQEMEMQPDDTVRYFRRTEWRDIAEDIREILQEMRELVGADTADKIEIEHSGGIDHSHGVDEETMEMIDSMDFEA